MKSIKESLLITIGILLVIWSFYIVLHQPAPAKYQPFDALTFLKFGDNTINIEVADTEALREQGLSGRKSLMPGSGMFFVFETPGVYGFWMKDMKFPIDIVWIDENFVVVGVEKSVDPETYPKLFYPPTAVKYVLELNSGDAMRLGIDMGTRAFSSQQK